MRVQGMVICDSILMILLGRKRKRGPAKKQTEKAKRSRVDRSSDAEQAEGQGKSRVTRSSRRTTPAAS